MTELVKKNEKRMFYMVRFRDPNNNYYATVDSPSTHLVIGMACEQLAAEYQKHPMDFLGMDTRIVETSSYTPDQLPSLTMKHIKEAGIDNAPKLVKSCISREHNPYYPPRVPMFKYEDGEATLCCVNAIQVASYAQDGYSVAGNIKNACVAVKKGSGKGMANRG